MFWSWIDSFLANRSILSQNWLACVDSFQCISLSTCSNAITLFCGVLYIPTVLLFLKLSSHTFFFFAFLSVEEEAHAQVCTLLIAFSLLNDCIFGLEGRKSEWISLSSPGWSVKGERWGRGPSKSASAEILFILNSLWESCWGEKVQLKRCCPSAVKTVQFDWGNFHLQAVQLDLTLLGSFGLSRLASAASPFFC